MLGQEDKLFYFIHPLQRFYSLFLILMEPSAPDKVNVGNAATRTRTLSTSTRIESVLLQSLPLLSQAGIFLQSLQMDSSGGEIANHRASESVVRPDGFIYDNGKGSLPLEKLAKIFQHRICVARREIDKTAL